MSSRSFSSLAPADLLPLSQYHLEPPCRVQCTEYMNMRRCNGVAYSLGNKKQSNRMCWFPGKLSLLRNTQSCTVLCTCGDWVTRRGAGCGCRCRLLQAWSTGFRRCSHGSPRSYSLSTLYCTTINSWVCGNTISITPQFNNGTNKSGCKRRGPFI